MKLKDMSIEELELMSYEDITYALLNENKKPMNTPELLKKIIELLGLNEEVYTSKIGDYYTSLTTDKRFILLDSAMWDLKDNHVANVMVEDDEETDEEEIEDEEEEIIEENDDIIDIDDDLDDGMGDLEIVEDDDELED